MSAVRAALKKAGQEHLLDEMVREPKKEIKLRRKDIVEIERRLMTEGVCLLKRSKQNSTRALFMSKDHVKWQFHFNVDPEARRRGTANGLKAQGKKAPLVGPTPTVTATTIIS